MSKSIKGGWVKHTPSQCRLRSCHYNCVSPGEDSQECIGCEGLKPEVKKEVKGEKID